MATVRFTLDPNDPPHWPAEAKARFDAFTDEEIEAMAGDPEEGILPPDDEMLARGVMGRTIRLAREGLGLTPEAFADRFALPLSEMRDWEDGRVLPERAMRAYLAAIAAEPAAVARAVAAAMAREAAREAAE